MMPNISMKLVSSSALWTVKAPIAQMAMITGAMMLNGMRRIAANNGTVVSTTMRPAMLPRYMLAIGPQTKRSEEHTSELQSLMRISYAVFCLKKKKTHDITI